MSYFDNSSFYNGGRRTSQMQKHILITAMATNRKILDGRAVNSDARQAKEAAWNDVMHELNMAGPEKSLTEWRKVWTDMRLQLRKKWDKAQNSKHTLTEYERRVINACGMVENRKDGNTHEKVVEDIDSFLAFLKEELLKEREFNHHETCDSRDESNSTSQHYLTDSSDYFTYEDQKVNIKDEFEEEPTNFLEYKEPSIECISDNDNDDDNDNDNEQITRIEEFREPSVQCISDDEEPMVVDDIKVESSPQMSHEDPHRIETVPRPIPIPEETVPRPIQVKCSERDSRSLSKLRNIKLPRRKKFKDATLKEIRKMHKNLLRQSKKQTALLRKLVQAMQR
ncbi:RNA polymerase II subunit 5-mediating protein homolog [Eupeodes corollae]|uniref:RNA polymerase II subunit 5-mediating protein homolog n=1 Tax=Eupeodes corollae TaxID=290404 RepID=UPI002490D4EC|nr:RNA polymerase II subunit 5-mediating protein homolog [Eupeodes corollae]